MTDTQNEVDRLSDELAANHARLTQTAPKTDKATPRPWAGRMDGLVLSQVGNVRFVLRIERHGEASTLDEEDVACMDLVLTAVNSCDVLIAALRRLLTEAEFVSPAHEPFTTWVAETTRAALKSAGVEV